MTATEKLAPIKVRDLIAILEGCDPDADVQLNFPGFGAYSDKEVAADPDLYEDQEHSSTPIFSACYVTSAENVAKYFDDAGNLHPGVKPNLLTIQLSDYDKESMIASRRRAIEGDGDPGEIELAPAVGDAETVIVDVAIPRSLHATIRKLLHSVNMSQQVREERACTHGPLTVAGLFSMLAEDVGMVETRPGCWEASNMAQVLSSHGYNY